MKFLICFVALASILVIGINAGEEEKEMIKSLAQDCKEKEGASDADVDAIADQKMPETEKGKCMVACMQLQFGVVEDGQFKKDVFVDFLKMKVTNEEGLKCFEKVADACATIAHEDRCEYGHLLGKCLENKTVEYGCDKYLE